MRVTWIAAVLAGLMLAACSQPAPEAPPAAGAAAAGIVVDDPWAAETPGAAQVAAGYMTIRNTGAEADRLIAVTSPSAGRVEVHEMALEDAMMRMRPVEGGLSVPGGGEIALAPGGYHLMFMEIHAPFIDGQIIPITLEFEKAGPVMAALPVRPREAGGAAHGGH